MSSLATQMNFGLAITAKDMTQGPIQGAMNSVRRFATLAAKPITIPLRIGRGGLALLRDLNLGLRPVISGIDRLVDRGARLDVVGKSFANLTGKSGREVAALGKSLVEAANGTIRIAEGMQIANRALAAGLNFEQLSTAMDFISKKSATTGKDAGEALNTVITGLSRGSTLFLDDFGILVDGVDGVRRNFDKIKGSGAFDALGPAAQKATIIRAAIAEMRQQMGAIGVSGKEAFFVWQKIKNEIGDAADKLALAISKSGEFQKVLTTVRDVLDGMAGRLEKGGGFGDMFAGLAKVGGALAMDFGESIGRYIAVGALDAFQTVAPSFAKAMGVTKEGILKIEAGMGFERFNKAVAELKGAAAGAAGKVASTVPKLSDEGRRSVNRDLAGLQREERRISGDTNFSIRRKAAQRADAELQARRARGERIEPGDRHKLIQQFRDEETASRLGEIRSQRAELEGRLGIGGIVGGGSADGDGSATRPSGGLTPGPLGRAAARRSSSTTRPAGRRGASRSPKQRARHAVETLPDQVASNISRLMAGGLSREASDFYVTQTMHNLGLLRKSLTDSGMEASGVNLDQLAIGDNGERLGTRLQFFEDWLRRERAEPGRPMDRLQTRSPLRSRVHSLRESSRSGAIRGLSEGAMARARRRLFELLEEQRLLTGGGEEEITRGIQVQRGGRVDQRRYDRSTARGTRQYVDDLLQREYRKSREGSELIRSGIGRMQQGANLEPLIKEASKKLDSVEAKLLKLIGVGEQQIGAITKTGSAIAGAIAGTEAALAASGR